MRAKDAIEGAQFLPAHEQLIGTRDEGNIAVRQFEGERVESTGIAMEEAKTGDSSGKQPDDCGLNAVELVPGLQLVSKPEQGGIPRALRETRSVKENDIVAATSFFDGLAVDRSPLFRIMIVPNRWTFPTEERRIERERPHQSPPSNQKRPRSQSTHP